MNVLLPQCAVTFEKHRDTGEKKKFLLVAGGRKPVNGWLYNIAPDRVVVCADRGLTYCLNDSVQPDMLLGDGDSARTDWQWAKECGLPMQEYPADKNHTDLELALAYISARQKECAELIISGVGGGRFDHAYSALFTISEYMLKMSCPVIIADHQEVLIVCQARRSLAVHCLARPKAISVLPLSEQATVSISGVHWPLTDAVLSRGRSNYVSNRLGKNSNILYFSAKKGLAGLYLFFNKFRVR